MTVIAGFSKFGQDLCRVFGENPKEVRTITLRSAPDEVITVTIEKYVQDENGERILETIRKVAWIEDEIIKESETENDTQ